MSIISQMNDKFEGFSLSNRNVGTYDKFLDHLSKKLKLGKKIGKNLLLTGELYPRLTASIFENGILLNRWDNPLTGELVGLCLVKNSSSKRPSKSRFVFTEPVLDQKRVSSFTFDGKSFTSLKEYNNSKDLIKSLGLSSEAELKEIVRDADTKMKSGIKDDSTSEVNPNKPVELPTTVEKVKQIRKSKPVKEDPKVLLTVCREFADNMKSSTSHYYGYRPPTLDKFNPYTDKRNCATMEIRSWGAWVVPDSEEDDGDYDWKELHSRWKKVLNEIEKSFIKKYPNLDFLIDISEKEWISVSVSYKPKL